MVATTGAQDSNDSSTSSFSGNDGDDDPGDPPSRHCLSAEPVIPELTFDPVDSFYHDGGSHDSRHDAPQVFVAEDVALLQDLLLDAPSQIQDSSSTATAVQNPLYHPVTDAAIVKSEPIHLTGDAAATRPSGATEESPSSVDDDTERLLAHIKSEVRQSLASSPTTAPDGAASTGTRERMESDASPSSQWLNWEDPKQVLDCAELPNASAIEIRRLKNRDSMRRSRQRQRDELEKMRETVSELESQYEQLCLRTSAGAASAGLTASDSTRDAASSRRAQSYLEAVDAAKHLGAENLHLKASIQDHAPWKLQLHRVLESDSFKNPVEKQEGALELEEMRAIYGFVPLSEEHVNDVILDSARRVQDVQSELLQSDYGGSSPRDHLTVFGWDIRRRRTGNEVEFAFVKRFPNVSAFHVMKKTWETDLKLEQFKQIKSETRRLDLLQQASANAVVMGRDVRFPDNKSVFRTVYVRFRMETASEVPSSRSIDAPPRCRTGYVVGTHSINPVNPDPLLPCVADHETLVWADMTLWMEMFNERDPVSGSDVCEVRWTGTTNYKSERQAYRSAADTLLGLLRWEAFTIAPVLTLL